MAAPDQAVLQGFLSDIPALSKARKSHSRLRSTNDSLSRTYFDSEHVGNVTGGYLHVDSLRLYSDLM